MADSGDRVGSDGAAESKSKQVKLEDEANDSSLKNAIESCQQNGYGDVEIRKAISVYERKHGSRRYSGEELSGIMENLRVGKSPFDDDREEQLIVLDQSKYRTDNQSNEEIESNEGSLQSEEVDRSDGDENENQSRGAIKVLYNRMDACGDNIEPDSGAESQREKVDLLDEANDSALKRAIESCQQMGYGNLEIRNAIGVYKKEHGSKRYSGKDLAGIMENLREEEDADKMDHSTHL